MGNIYAIIYTLYKKLIQTQYKYKFKKVTARLLFRLFIV